MDINRSWSKTKRTETQPPLYYRGDRKDIHAGKMNLPTCRPLKQATACSSILYDEDSFLNEETKGSRDHPSTINLGLCLQPGKAWSAQLANILTKTHATAPYQAVL